MNYGRIGSISAGTRRTEDLLAAFSDALEDLVLRNAAEWCSDEGRETRDIYMRLVGEAREQDIGATNGDDEYLVNALHTALELFAAPYCYFGIVENAPDDSSDFGFWPCLEEMEADVLCDSGLIKVSDTSEVTSEYQGFVMQVSDHGNVTLYSKQADGLTEVWSCV